MGPASIDASLNASGGSTGKVNAPQGKGKPPSIKKQPKGAPPLKSSTASSSAPPESSTSGLGKKNRRKKESNEGTTKSKSSDAGGEDPVGKIRLKTVIRRLPPNVPEAVFWKSVSPWVTRPSSMMTELSDTTDDSKANIDYGYFVQGKLKDSSRRRVSADAGTTSHVFSRAYLHFTTIEALIAFHRGFDGHLFKDAKGNETIAIVEFAPFQRTPLDLVKKRKADLKEGTIEEDADYQAFLTSLEKKKAEDNGQTQAEKTDAQLMSQLMTAKSAMATKQSSAKHTPLLDHLRAQHTARAEANALKNARKYLNRNNDAYAASKAGASASTAGKGKGKAKEQAKGGSAVPTGPKAAAKPNKKGAKKGADKAEPGNGSNLAPKVAAAAPSDTQAGPKVAKGPKGPKSQSNKGFEPLPNEGVSILSKQGNSEPSVVPIPTGPSADRGAPRGRSRPSRGGGGRGRGGKASRGGAPSSAPPPS